ncbi:MAG TPA: cyclic peptide export ABC transporter [Verrucomicrobiae bacterium]|nr:cyclic peptide export ABC transporter [Verrucomicrobiae bacterium]
MNLLRFLFRSARGLALLTGLAALASGACNAGLIALVNAVLNRPQISAALMIGSFVALGFGKLTTNFVSQVLVAKFSQRAIARLRCDLVGKILSVPLRHLEELGAPRLMVALGEDVLTVAEALLLIPNFAVNLAVLCGGAVYLCCLSWKVAVGMFAFILLGAAGYRLLVANGFEHLRRAREEADRLYAHFRALTDGIKELKLHRSRCGKFLSDCIRPATENVSRHNIAAEFRFILAHGWSQLLFFTLVGLILFLLPVLQHINPRALTGYIVATLYLMGPLTGVLGVMAAIGRANVALEKIERLGFSLARHDTEEWSLIRPERKLEFAQLELVGVTHSYHHEKDDSHFILGPMNLTFRPGELVFLVGGNGSGKSTLAKIITGLYPPEAGQLRLDGRAISASSRDDYRQLFSAVFADFYVFETLLGLDVVNLDGQAQNYLAELHLDHKVKIRDGRLSTVDLSQGQRKRLALLTAYLEDRPFYLFDEWASDQDPQFKEIFYRKILSDLKARGKAVVVITHDDRYFACADRILKLDFGKLVYDRRSVVPRVAEPALQPASNGDGVLSSTVQSL